MRKVAAGAVIESPRYEAEARRLAREPIIVAMERGVPAGVEMGCWEFVSAAHHEYARRGGTGAESIGGPARAIAMVRARRSP